MQMTAMLLLQFRYDLKEQPLYRRCRRDLGFRYAIGLGKGEKPPSMRSLRRFRKKLLAAKGDDFLLRLSLRLAVEDGLLDDGDLQAINSTNTDCRGAVIDTYNLVAAAIKQVIRKVAGCLGQRPAELARRWELQRYMARSIKGQADIAWDDEQARNRLLTEEICDADRLAERLDTLQETVTLPQEVTEVLELLQKVSRQDVEQLDDGTYRIVRGTAPGRIISITDPEARHGRKSSSKLINGFKTHLIGTIISQFVTGIVNTDAATHDAKPSPELIRQAEANGVKPSEAVGDNAYGTGENLRACNEEGVPMRTKLAQPSHKGALPKRDFDINVEGMQVTCPGGQATKDYTLVQADGDAKQRVPLFHFTKEACQQCDLKDKCCSKTAKGGKRTIKFSPFERELQQNKAFNATERAPVILRARSSIERLISHLVKMGMRHARFFGMIKMQMQSYMVAAAYNLQRYITLKVQAAKHHQV